jgi:3-oxoadipate enol-lactonase
MLGKITTPTLVVHGSQDALVPLSSAKRYQAGIPQATLRTLDGCGHFAYLEQPRQLATLIGEFINA